MSDDLETAVGVLQGIEERQGGWHRFSIALPGMQYPLKLDTKQEDIIDAARATMGEPATFFYKEKDADKINPHTNKPYVNRYLEGVEAGVSPAAEAAAAQTSQKSPAGGKSGEMSKEDWEAKERRDYRSRAWGQVLGATEHLITKDDVVTADAAHALFDRLHPLQKMVYRDIVRDIHQEDDDDVPF